MDPMWFLGRFHLDNPHGRICDRFALAGPLMRAITTRKHPVGLQRLRL